MRIIDGDEIGLMKAISIIEADPNEEHIREDSLMRGSARTASELLTESLSNSDPVAYAVDDDAAVVCGLGLLGFTRFQIWMLASESTTKRPLWLRRQMRRFMRLADGEMFKGAIYWQVIPPEYERGLNFVQHLGFEQKGHWRSPVTGKRFVVVEREVR